VPYRDERLDGGRGIIRFWTGVVATRELTDATVADYEGREHWPQVEYFISDFTGVTDLSASPAEIRELSSAEIRSAPFIPNLIMAVVAPSDLTYGMARMWQVFAQKTGWSLGVFRTRPEADAWVQELRAGDTATEK
jgi:hypothetical protein